MTLFGQEFEAKVWSTLWSCTLVRILRLKFGRCLQDELKILNWKFDLPVIWLKSHYLVGSVLPFDNIFRILDFLHREKFSIQTDHWNFTPFNEKDWSNISISGGNEHHLIRNLLQIVLMVERQNFVLFDRSRSNISWNQKWSRKVE